MPNTGSLAPPHRVLVTGACVVAPSAYRQPGYLQIALDPQELLGPERGRRLDPLSQWAIVATERARAHAHVPPAEVPKRHPDEGIAVGSALGACATSIRYANRLVTAGPAATNPIDFPDSIDGAPAAHVAIALGLGGPSLTFVDGRASARSALLFAARQVAWGRVARMHVVAGDRFESLLGEAMAGDPSYGGNTNGAHAVLPAEAVVALVLEPLGLRDPPEHTIELVIPTAEQAQIGRELETEVSPTQVVGWSLGDDGAVHWGARVPLGSQRISDPSGALDLAAAWLLAVGQGANLVGVPDPGPPPAMAEPPTSGWPGLGFVRFRSQ